MRGIVSLAAALALPLTVASSAPFPFRAEIILLTFAVILATLVVQGLSLTPLIRWLNLKPDQTLAREEAHAREQAASAALQRLDQLATESWPMPEDMERLQDHYTQRAKRFANPDAVDSECSPEAAAAYRRLKQEALTAERERVIELRDQKSSAMKSFTAWSTNWMSKHYGWGWARYAWAPSIESMIARWSRADTSDQTNYELPCICPWRRDGHAFGR